MYNTFLPLELVQSQDFQEHIAKLETAMPRFFNHAPVAEIIDRYTGRISVAEMDDAMATAQDGVK